MFRTNLFSIGHSNYEKVEDFTGLLVKYDISVLADVRSAPYSRYSPHFNKRNLEGGLAAKGIRYVFLGDELGGRPEGAEYFDREGYALYGRRAQAHEFQAGLERLLGAAESARTAMMCSEADPAGCHRYLLVTRALYNRERVEHIRSDGSVIATEDIPTFWVRPSLFKETEETVWKSLRPVLREKPPPSSLRR